MRMGGARGFGIVVWLLGILQTSACASDLVFEDGRYRHRLRHYSIANPGGEGSAWRRVEVEGAELAFQGPDRATMSLIEQCGRSRAEPRVLARQLWIGLEGRTMVDQGPVGADGSRGWIQRFDATANDETVRLKTVTRVIGECSYDWILVVSRGLEGPETAFDQWWKSFRGPTPEAGREEGG